MDLKDHFSRDATEDIESVFLISKSNCAFVNYKTEDSCAAAMTRFHDSRFRGVRLVCRLRRGSNSTTSPGPGNMASAESKDEKTILSDTEGSIIGQEPPNQLVSPPLITSTIPPEKIAKEKFFIVKSLTIEDLERSVNSGIWATQSHNEENLNLAFQVSQDIIETDISTDFQTRLQRMSTSSSLPTNLASTSAMLEWIPRSVQMLLP